MALGISPNNLNKISQVYLSKISEHHKKDADGNTIPHEDENIGEEKVDMKKYLDKKAKMLTKKREAQSDAAKTILILIAHILHHLVEISMMKLCMRRSRWSKLNLKILQRLK